MIIIKIILVSILQKMKKTNVIGTENYVKKVNVKQELNKIEKKAQEEKYMIF